MKDPEQMSRRELIQELYTISGKINVHKSILDILTWLTGEKTILTNSLDKNEINQTEFKVRMNNAIARCVTEIKELL